MLSLTVRRLDVGDWELLRRMRLQALRTDSGNFGGKYEDEANRPQEFWVAWINGGAVFGLFDHSHIVGMTSVFISRDDPTGSTAYMAASYILPEYRGNGYFDKLYTARIEWAKSQPGLKKAIVSHRDGNEAQRRATVKHGFLFASKAMQTWPDHTSALELTYELQLRSIPV